MGANHIEIEVDGESISCSREELRNFEFFSQFPGSSEDEADTERFVFLPTVLTLKDFLDVRQLSQGCDGHAELPYITSCILQHGYDPSRLVAVADYLGHAELARLLAAIILQPLSTLTFEQLSDIASGKSSIPGDPSLLSTLQVPAPEPASEQGSSFSFIARGVSQLVSYIAGQHRGPCNGTAHNVTTTSGASLASATTTLHANSHQPLAATRGSNSNSSAAEQQQLDGVESGDIPSQGDGSSAAGVAGAAPSAVHVKAEDFMGLVRAIEESALVPLSTVQPAMQQLGFRAKTWVEHDHELRVHGFANGGPTELYAELLLSAANLAEMKPVALELVVKSHDQGWSSSPSDLHGTVEGSYTWGTCCVVDSSTGEKLSAESNEEVYRNLHAVEHTQTHLKNFGATSHLVQTIDRALASGKDVGLQLLATAYYPGWVNHVNGATITCYMAPRMWG